MADPRSPRSSPAGAGRAGSRHIGPVRGLEGVWGDRFPPRSGGSRGVVPPGVAPPSGASTVPGEAHNAVRHNGISLSSGSSLTVEPGGQLELSSAPAATLGELIEVTGRDLAALRDAAAAVGLELCGYGLDPLRPPRRVLDLPRYAAMEKFFDREGPWGRQMMCGTASVQVCLDSGDEGPGESGYRARWRLLHAIGPVLVAAFANSPIRGGQPTGWRSARQQVWSNMNPGRTRAPAPPTDDGDPRDAWTAYALDAELMCVREPESADWSAPPGLTFREWLRVRRFGRAARAHPGRPGLSPVHLVPAGPPARAHGGARDRRAARRRLDRARGRRHGPDR